MPPITRTAAEVAAMLEDGREIAFLDVREVVPFGAGHPLLATNLPIGRIEGEIARLVPRPDTRVVVPDGGESLASGRDDDTSVEPRDRACSRRSRYRPRGSVISWRGTL